MYALIFMALLEFSKPSLFSSFPNSPAHVIDKRETPGVGLNKLAHRLSIWLLGHSWCRNCLERIRRHSAVEGVTLGWAWRFQMPQTLLVTSFCLMLWVRMSVLLLLQLCDCHVPAVKVTDSHLWNHNPRLNTLLYKLPGSRCFNTAMEK